MDAKYLNCVDPLKKQVERGESALSPMEPPEAFAPPGLPEPLANPHPFLAGLMDEHARMIAEIDHFEAAIVGVPETGFTKVTCGTITEFLRFFDQEFVEHHRREEERFFPLLHERLIADGEHSKARIPMTPVSVMADEHLKAIQLAAVTANLLEIARHLSDGKSRLIVLDATLEKGRALAELLRLHIFREDHVVFPRAAELMTREELDAMMPKPLNG